MNKRKAQKVGLKKGESEIRSRCSVIIKREGEKKRDKWKLHNKMYFCFE